MNLKLEDLSQYIVLVIFVLIIIKVLGDGFFSTIYELLTGKKKEDDLDIDSMIRRKKSQLNLTPQVSLSSAKDANLKQKILQFPSPDNAELLQLLSSLEWGDINKNYAKESVNLLGDISSTKGLSKILNVLFKKEIDQLPQQILKSWIKTYDKSILWTNLVNKSKEVEEKKSLLLLRGLKIENINTLSDLQIAEEVENLLNPNQVSSLIITQKPFTEITPTEIYEQYKENLNLFKSLRPIMPINKESNNKWAQEVLGLDQDDHSEEEVKKKYKEITIKIHPDKFSSLDLTEEQISILNSNLALVNKAYSFLKK